MIGRRTVVTGLVALSLGTFAAAEELKVVGYNVESDGAKASVVKGRLAELDGVAVWGLSEVRNTADADILQGGAAEGESGGPAFKKIVGTTGMSDRLAIIYNDARLEEVGHEELHGINTGGRFRSPLVARFRLRSSGQEFLFIVNHLARGDATFRHTQATLLNEWAQAQDLPVIAVGDYNFDFGVNNGDLVHDAGLDNILAGDVFRWIRPAPPLVKTQDSAHNSVLDFVFVAGPAKSWLGTSVIIVKAGDLPDNDDTSDHRPVLATFEIAAPTPVQVSAPVVPTRARLAADGRRGPASRAAILKRIEALEAQLSELKAMVQQLPPE